MLYGMAEPMHAAIRRLGLRLRVYAPVGELVPGMAYLVRRLLENTSNESFVRHRFAEGRDARRAGRAADGRRSCPTRRRRPGARRPTPTTPAPYQPEPRRRVAPAPASAPRSAAAVAAAARARPIDVPARHRRRARCAPRDDDRVGRPGATPIASSPARRRARAAEADAAVAAAPTRRATAWRRTPAARAGRRAVPRRRLDAGRGATSSPRSRCSRRASRGTRPTPTCARRSTSASTTAARCSRLDARRRRRSRRPASATACAYQAQGRRRRDRAVELPARHPDAAWSTAALVAGNTVRLQAGRADAGASPARLVEALRGRRAARRACWRSCPASARRSAPDLVEHPDVAFIAFTGSKAVGLAINERPRVHQPGQRHVKRVVAEMGGKNAHHRRRRRRPRPGRARPSSTSAFGFAGQKCSAASRVDRRSTPSTTSSSSGWSARPRAASSATRATWRVQVGPVIDADAHDAACAATSSAARSEGTVLRRSATTCPTAAGSSARRSSPTSTTRRRRWRTDEIFGPVLAGAPGRRLRRTPSRSPTTPTTR